MHKAIPTALLAVMMVGAFSSAGAQTQNDGKSLKACRGINDSAQRLACYDRFTDSIGRDVVLNAPARPYDPIKDFGGGPDVRRADDAAKVSSITAKITEARYQRLGGWTFAIDTGAVWQQLDTVDPRKDPKPGAVVELKSNAVGGFFAKVDEGRAFRVKRVR